MRKQEISEIKKAFHTGKLLHHTDLRMLCGVWGE